MSGYKMLWTHYCDICGYHFSIPSYGSIREAHSINRKDLLDEGSANTNPFFEGWFICPFCQHPDSVIRQRTAGNSLENLFCWDVIATKKQLNICKANFKNIEYKQRLIPKALASILIGKVAKEQGWSNDSCRHAGT